MAKKTRPYPDFIKKLDWPAIIFILFLVIFLGGITARHFFIKQQQLRWEKYQALQRAELTQASKLSLTQEMIDRADLNQDQQVDQADVAIMEEAFLKIDNISLEADLNQDGRVDTNDYVIMVRIIGKQNQEE
jgi:hypothetical protein